MGEKGEHLSLKTMPGSGKLFKSILQPLIKLRLIKKKLLDSKHVV